MRSLNTLIFLKIILSHGHQQLKLLIDYSFAFTNKYMQFYQYHHCNIKQILLQSIHKSNKFIIIVIRFGIKYEKCVTIILNILFCMFPSVIKDESLKEKIKQKNWDDRFVSKGGIPEYSPLKDKHTKNYRRSIGNQKKEDDQEVPTKQKKATYFQKRMELIDQLTTMHKSNQKLLEEYEEIAGKYKLPNFYIYYTLLPLLSSSTSITQYLFNQKKLMKEQSTFYHRITAAIKARQECLQRIRKTLDELKEQKMQEKKRQLKEQIDHYRFLTQNVIDQIKRWRDSLGKIDERPVFYNDNQENYIIKLLNDNKFIFNSKLALALSFAQKNDPFLLIPVKKAEGKESSLFIEIVQLTKEPAHYQKYMEYLASQKAYELSVNPPEKQQYISKNPSVQKIYKSNQPKFQVQAPITKEEPQEQFKKLQAIKMRQERLKKNQERIKSIKSIYETYSKKLEDRNYRSERKLPQTDSEDKRGIKRRSESIKIKNEASDNQFQTMVKARIQVSKTPFRLKRDSKSSTKLQKTEDKMIESLKDIQSTLKNKLQILQHEEKTQIINSSLLNSTQTKFARKNNEQIIKQLKQEIMAKIEKESVQKDKIKKIKRQQQEKMLEQIKAKLKKQMQQKLQQKKKEKLLQREELQKKLKQEEQRLNSQKQLELQLQLKLNRQKQLRQLQKIKRQALQRQKKYKEQLQKQQKLRKEREEAMQRQRREKERLMEQLKKKQIREQIEEQLRHQIKGSQVQRDRVEEKVQQDYIRSQKQIELSKQLQSLKLKEGLEMEQLKRENQLRQRMLKLKKDEQQLKRKEIEHLMKMAVQSQKQHLEKETVQRRIQIEQNMRNNVKQKLLEEYRNEKELKVEQIKNERQKQLQEQIYREKIRQKIERQMRIQAINRTKKDLDQRQNKKYQIKTKLQQVKNHFDKQITLDKNKIEQQVKKQMIERVIFDKQAQKQAAKHDLRMQFQKDLFTSAVPQIYENKDSFQVRNINYFQGDLHLNSKLNQNKPTNQKPSQNQSPKKNQVKQGIDTMTLQQLQIYEKQKQKVNQMKEQKIIVASKLPQQQEGFQQVKIQKSKKQDEGYQVKLIKNQSSKKEQLQKKEKKKKKKKESDDSIDSQDKKKSKRKPKKNHYYQQQSQDSQDIAKKKKKKNRRKKHQSSQEQNSSLEVKPSKKISPTKNKQKQYKSSQQQQKKQKKVQEKKQDKKQQMIQRQPSQVHYDAQKSKINYNPIDQITYKPQKVSNNSEKFNISLQAIPEAQFDQYLQVHLSRVPPIQLLIQMHNRQQLYRKLIGELTFCLLIGQYEGRVIGLALAYHDRSRQDLRKFTIIHMAAYKNQDIKDFILSITNFIFRKDPADQIEFHYKFNETDSSQLQFSTDFNKWFDKYGSVFQKKSDESVYERKYVLKRQFNQKCQVVLGGVNKNSFRNIFSVYCGVLMSDTDMLQFKEELVDTLAPQNQICYSIMVAEIFRTYLSPDQAESLKNKVKQFAKLKQMLILVVMMQKKKVKLEELKLYQYKNLIELNMRLMSQGKDIIRYCKDGNAELNRLYYAQLNHAFNLPFHFQTTSLPVQNKDNQIRQISYFRLSSLPPFKLHIIKSSLYNAQMNILPTENSKYKIFVLSAQEYNEIKESNHLDLFMYIRLFLKNVKSHNVAVWKYVWLPQMTDKGAWNLREYRSFLNKDFYTHDSINISYRQFLPGALIIEPEHRDLVITPPFIVGVMSMSLEQVSEGSPIYARMIEIDALKTLQVQKIETRQ